MITQNAKNKEMIKNRYKTLGPQSSRLLTDLTEARQTTFTIRDAAKILKVRKSKLWKILKHLTDAGWLLRLERGKYLILPLDVNPKQAYTEHHFIIASKLIHPYYIGYVSMLNYYGYTEQLSNTVYIASTKRKKELRITGVTYKFISLPARKMFGITNIVISGTRISVSNKEKTIVDCFDHPKYSAGIIEPAKGLWNARNDIDFDKLVDFVRRIDNSAVAKRLGYLLELYTLGDKNTIDSLRNLVASGYSLLDPLLPKTGATIARWNLRRNVTDSDLLSWRKT